MTDHSKDVLLLAQEMLLKQASAKFAPAKWRTTNHRQNRLDLSRNTMPVELRQMHLNFRSLHIESEDLSEDFDVLFVESSIRYSETDVDPHTIVVHRASDLDIHSIPVLNPLVEAFPDARCLEEFRAEHLFEETDSGLSPIDGVERVGDGLRSIRETERVRLGSLSRSGGILEWMKICDIGRLKRRGISLRFSSVVGAGGLTFVPFITAPIARKPLVVKAAVMRISESLCSGGNTREHDAGAR